MKVQGWCSQHLDRLHGAKDARLAAELLVVKCALATGRFLGSNGCWACAMSEIEFQAALRDAERTWVRP